MYDMTLKELSETIENRKKGLAYELWKQAMLITIGFSDANRTKGEAMFPKTPQEACPELYPPRPSLKIKTPLNKKYKERS